MSAFFEKLAGEASFAKLVGRTLKCVKCKKGDGEALFVCDTGETFRLISQSECCNDITIEDICGDLADLIGSPILQAEESTSQRDGIPIPKNFQASFTWTFYRIATIKGQVVIRWFGTSNGYYSESVDCVLINGGAK